ncbi:hypothetical protein ACIPC1_33745 [Streptomyces sp. NPDC087263]|uniref:hypothetical protein n=1 Tax=Streptomyces sp. NPDC087263 TaxID=3365773 RepID=UPI0037F8ABC5
MSNVSARHVLALKGCGRLSQFSCCLQLRVVGVNGRLGGSLDSTVEFISKVDLELDAALSPEHISSSH